MIADLVKFAMHIFEMSLGWMFFANKLLLEASGAGIRNSSTWILKQNAKHLTLLDDSWMQEENANIIFNVKVKNAFTEAILLEFWPQEEFLGDAQDEKLGKLVYLMLIVK